MFERLKHGFEAVRYGSIEVRRRWFFGGVIGLFIFIIIVWIACLLISSHL